MTLFHAILLGLVQGATEFLPVSSTAHLTLAENLLFGRSMPLAFDVLMHVGTLLALATYYRRDLARILRGFAGRDPGGRRLGLLLLLAMVPTGLFGLATRSLKEAAKGHIWIHGACLLLTAGMLWGADRFARRRRGRDLEAIGPWDALAVGSIQGLGGGFGLSRSGSTLSVGVFRGLALPASLRFSFLLGVPTIAAAAVLEGGKLVGPLIYRQPLPPAMAFPPGSVSPVLACGAGIAAAALSGYAAIGLLDRLTRTSRLAGFAVYCVIVGAILLALGAGSPLG